MIQASLRRFALWGLGLIVVLLLIWTAGDVLLLAFAGILLAVILRALADWLRRVIPLGPQASFGLVAAIIVVLFGLGIWLLAPQVIQQTGDIVQTVPTAWGRLQAYLGQSGWGQHLLDVADRGVAHLNIGARLTVVADDFFGAVAAVVVVLAVGFFAGLHPEVYRDGVLKLLPPEWRGQARTVLHETGFVLRWWLLGQLVPMSVLGVGVMIGLRALGVPLAFTLGLFTGLMIFVPYAGALLSWVPCMLVALVQSPWKAFEVTVMFVGVHVLEGYVITPLSQKRAVHLPPALTILSQLLMWTLAGLAGVAIATPLTAAVLGAVRVLYLHEKPNYEEG